MKNASLSLLTIVVATFGTNLPAQAQMVSSLGYRSMCTGIVTADQHNNVLNSIGNNRGSSENLRNRTRSGGGGLNLGIFRIGGSGKGSNRTENRQAHDNTWELNRDQSSTVHHSPTDNCDNAVAEFGSTQRTQIQETENTNRTRLTENGQTQRFALGQQGLTQRTRIQETEDTNRVRLAEETNQMLIREETRVRREEIDAQVRLGYMQWAWGQNGQ